MAYLVVVFVCSDQKNPGYPHELGITWVYGLTKLLMALIIDAFSEQGDVLLELFVSFDQVGDLFTGMHGRGVVASANLVANGRIRTLNFFS